MTATKRPSPSIEEDGSNKKKQRKNGLKHHKIRYRQPGSRLATANSQNTSVIEQQLSRALCITLYAAGFTAAEPSALASFHSQVDTYMRHFASLVNKSMQHSRRSKPLPHDFIHALAQKQITPSSLVNDLEHSIPAIVTQQPILLSPVSITNDFFAASRFDNETSDTMRRLHRHVPKHFPSFPAIHAYRDTEVFSARESDVRRIRELSTQEGMLAEQALRKLVAANRLGLRHKAESTRTTEQDLQRQKTERVWRDALRALLTEDEEASKQSQGQNPYGMALDGVAEKRTAASISAKDIDADGVLVNYDRVHWRRGGAHGRTLPAS